MSTTLVRVAFLALVVLALTTACYSESKQAGGPKDPKPTPQSVPEAAAALAATDTPEGLDLLALWKIAKKYPDTREGGEATSILGANRPNDNQLYLAIAALDRFDTEEVADHLKNYVGPNIATLKAIREELKSPDYQEQFKEYRKGQEQAKSICRAAIGTVMGRDPGIIKATISDANPKEVELFYIRQNDGTRWEYKCKLEDNRAIWGIPSGRWRTLPEDGTVTFTISGSGDSASVTIEDKLGGSTISTKSFKLKQLR